MPPVMKSCTKCRESRFVVRFSWINRAKNRRQSWCKDCMKEYLHSYYENLSPEQVEAKLASERDRYERNIETERARCRRYQRENLDVMAARARRNEPIRRARLMGAVHEVVEPRVVFERDEGICGLCGDPVDSAEFHLDHVVPLARGGDHTYENVQVAHPLCNMKKGAKAVA